jgi:SWI/SNF-related matrix-associated actin-dependent regulator of chromatin subfamily A member 5
MYVPSSSSAYHSLVLVICPLSVLESWFSELKRWSPKLKPVRFHGNASERIRLKQQAVDLDYDVIVTTYEMVLSEVHWFTNRYTYRYVVIDEGHRVRTPSKCQRKLTERLKTNKHNLDRQSWL